ncbi:MAG: hypothetical protein JWO69_1856, partial [Thermoleophilia bacterium]|nr:hypothetical protein [Thermoleophilia bacterium]
MQIANQLVPAQFRAAATMFEAAEYNVGRAMENGHSWRTYIPMALEQATSG